MMIPVTAFFVSVMSALVGYPVNRSVLVTERARMVLAIAVSRGGEVKRVKPSVVQAGVVTALVMELVYHPLSNVIVDLVGLVVAARFRSVLVEETAVDTACATVSITILLCAYLVMRPTWALVVKKGACMVLGTRRPSETFVFVTAVTLDWNVTTNVTVMVSAMQGRVHVKKDGEV